MLDTIKIGLLRLDTKKNPHGYMRMIPKESSKQNEISSFFRIPLHVVFDKEGYNSYKEYKAKENPEFKTWVQDITILVPPNPENCEYYKNAGYEWFLGNLQELAKNFSNFPQNLQSYVQQAITEYSKVKREMAFDTSGVEDDYDSPMNKAEKVAARHSLKLFGILQRSRFDPGRPKRKGEFTLIPFTRYKGDKSAKEVIETVTTVVSDYVWQNPKVSKYSETEGAGLKFKLTSLFLECFYKEQIKFMRKKLEQDLKIKQAKA